MEEAKRVTNGETDTADDNNGVQLNTGEVEKVIDAVNELNGGDYTSASWAVVKVRLKDARKALKNATEQAQLDEAAAQLNQAIAELRISDGTNEDPEPDLPPESTYIDGVYPVTVLCLPDADMDFEAPVCVKEALKNYVDFGVYGYYQPPKAYFEAFENWEEKYHDYKVEDQWIRFAPGVVPAFNWLIQILTKEKDGVIIMSPVYYPFRDANYKQRA